MTYAYARVSSKEQNLDRQIRAFDECKFEIDKVYAEKQSGKDFNRPRYQALVRVLKPGDLLIIKSLDRLGRNYEEIQSEWRKLTKDKQVDIVVLDMPLLDTTMAEGLLGTFIADLVLQVLAFTAQMEREQIKQRQQEGIEAAKARGVKFGRPEKKTPENFTEMAEKWRSGELTGAEAAEHCGMPLSTFRYKAGGQHV